MEEKRKWTPEALRSLIDENGIKTTSELNQSFHGAYKYMKNSGLDPHELGLETRKDCCHTLEEINEVIRVNGFTSMKDLMLYSKRMYNEVYTNKWSQELVWPNGKINPNRKLNKRTRRYDIWKVMDYLRKYAKEEGISLRDAAVKYGYYPEWQELVKEGKAPSEYENC